MITKLENKIGRKEKKKKGKKRIKGQGIQSSSILVQLILISKTLKEGKTP